MNEVDSILNNWFGEPPEHSDDERRLIKFLYEPLRKIEAERDRLREKVSEQLWRDNPDRMCGQYTEEEIRRAGEW